LSQVAHIPFNYVAFSNINPLLQPSRGSSGLILTAIVAGLSAGLFEEGARYLTFRYWVRDARTWRQSLMLGAGHGGLEAILLGIIAGLNIAILIGYQHGYFTNFVASVGEQEIVQVIDALYFAPWYRTLFGALERLFAICLQITFSVLVLQAVTRNKWFWMLIVISWHALVDALAVWSIATSGAEVAELIVGVLAIFGLVVTFLLRRPDPVESPPEPLPANSLVKPLKIELSSEKLDDSRYSG